MAAQSINLWDRIMMAITFAEAGEAVTAKEMLEMNKRQENRAGKQKAKEQRPTLQV